MQHYLLISGTIIYITMNTKIESLITRLDSQSSDVMFDEVMTLIDELYEFSPTSFVNGGQRNEAGENSGSCKVLSFALLNSLTEEQTLLLFGQYYRDVKASPEADDHQNIRQFILHGFSGLKFDSCALLAKA